MKAIILLLALASPRAEAMTHQLWPKPYWKCSVPFCEYVYDKEDFDQYQSRKNPLLAPPTNMATGDSGSTVAKKLVMSRVDIIQSMAKQKVDENSAIKNLTKDINKVGEKLAKVTNHSLSVRSRMCDLKSAVNYDLNQNSATASEVCEPYNARATYSTFTDTYEVSLFKQVDRTFKVGIKSTDLRHECLVFVEGTW